MRSQQDQSEPTRLAAPERGYDYEIVMVTYYSRKLLEALLPTLPRDLPIAVVDNAQGADGVGELLIDRPAARYLHGPGRGFGSGANLGVRTSSYGSIVFLNPDCSPSVDHFDALVGELRDDPQLALVALTTALPDGSIEIGVGGWEPTVGRAVVHAVGLHKLFPSRGLWARPERGRPIELDWLGAACMASPRGTFLALGGYDETYFVYNEDVEFSRSVREAGLRQKVLTDIVVPHLGAGSGDEKPVMLAMRGAMTMQYVSRHNSRLVAQGFRLALTGGYAARYVLCRARGRRSLAQEHAAYLRGMWFGPPDMG